MLLLIYAKMWGTAYDDNVSGKACEVHVCGQTQQSLMKCDDDRGALGGNDERRKECDAQLRLRRCKLVQVETNISL
jgi:hypothetical protein